jgi:hypothetical protein
VRLVQILLTVKGLGSGGFSPKTGHRLGPDVYSAGVSNTVATAIYWFNLEGVNEYSEGPSGEGTSLTNHYPLDKYSLIFDNIRARSEGGRC